MGLKNRIAVVIGKCISSISKIFGIGAGATWPGEIALSISPDILQSLSNQFRQGIILVAGTNGKTTTSLMLKTILHYEELKVVYNASGANLLNGIVSASISACSMNGNMNADWGVFEVDENSLPTILRYVRPKYIILLNLFRDQLDRYGEVDSIGEKWKKAFLSLGSETTLVLNADDPLIASFGKNTKANTVFFGLDNIPNATNEPDHAVDSGFCLNCGARLSYNTYYFSHLGDWYCRICGEKRPQLSLSSFESPLPGLYNKYNTYASVLTAQRMNIHNSHIKESLQGFVPAFGRQEEKVINGKTVKLFLSKNPAGFNATLRAVLEMNPKVILLALNDKIPDGRDVSWIWDVDFDMIRKECIVVVTGDRTFDMALRMQYTKDNQIKSKKQTLFVISDIKQAVTKGLSLTANKDKLYVLTTYSAMLDIRKIITGRKIL
jgi:UDP-N-acetylmuramyl tripeptide synthase